MDAYNVPGHLDILLVDDSISILKITSTMLRRHGHIVTEVENGAEALELMREKREQGLLFDCVVMDLQMPVMDGLEAMRRLRREESSLAPSATYEAAAAAAGASAASAAVVSSDQQQQQQQQKCEGGVHQFVVGCTANSDHATSQEAYGAGFDAFMNKPFAVETFYEIIGDLNLPARD